MNLYSGTSSAHKRLLVAVLAAIALLCTTTAASPASTGRAHDTTGEHAFDWEIGKWRSTVRVLADPLSDTPDEWLRFSGTSVVKRLHDSRANVVEFDVEGPAGHIEALNLRLFESGSERWSSTFVNLRDGLLMPPVHGTFEHGVGTFYGKDTLDGRPIDVRFVITRQGPHTARFEQAFSDDGGVTWETNWITVDHRVR